MKSCAVTGHRPQRFKYTETSEEGRLLKHRMLGVLSGLYKKGVRRFYVGGALGVDMWVGELLAWLREKPEYPGIELVMALPFENYEKRWEPQEQERLHTLMERCSEVVTVGFMSSPYSYLQRNRYMVDRADCLFAVYDGVRTSHSGTCFTVEYAASKDLPIWMLDPDTLELKTI